MRRVCTTPRHHAVAAALQLWHEIDPDCSRELAERLLFAADRAASRGDDGAPTRGEIDRAVAHLQRCGFAVPRDVVADALLIALCPGVTER